MAFLALLLLPNYAHAAEPLCDICFRSFISLNLSDAVEVAPNIYMVRALAHATYYNSTITQGSGGGQPFQDTNPSSNPTAKFFLANATNAELYFKFNGMDIVNNNNQTPCSPILTSPNDTAHPYAKTGEAACELRYYRNHRGVPTLLSEAPTCGILSVELNRSFDDLRVKPGLQTAIFCPPRPNAAQSIWPILGAWIADPALYMSCIGGFIALGLLIASMYYDGKNPLSLLDITSPRLPAGRKARMPKATIPYHLAHKGRINDRVIMRAEKAITSQLVSLYRRGGARNTTDVARQAKLLFAQYGSNRQELLSRLRSLGAKSGMRPDHVNAVMRGVERMADIRMAADIDKQRFGFARSGGPITGPFGKMLGTRNWPGAKITKYGPKIAKPWKFIPGVEGKKWADKIPGIPYVERVSLIAGNWFGSRFASISMRRDVRRAAMAEIGSRAGLVRKDSAFYQKYSYDKKKIGEIPAIVERMHQETIHLGRAVQEEVLRKVMVSLAARREQLKNGDKQNPELVLVERRLKEIMVIIHKVEQERKAAAERGEDYAKHEKLLHGLLAYAKKEGLIEYKIGADGKISVIKNNNFLMIHDGDPKTMEHFREKRMSPKELEYFLNLIRQSERIIGQSASIRNGTLTRDGRDPLFFDANGKPIRLNPEDVRSRYEQMYGLLAPDRARWREGRLPFTPLAVDLGEYSGRILLRTDANYRANTGEVYRTMRVRMRMEEELAFRRMYDYLVSQRAMRESADTYGFKLGENWYRDMMGFMGVKSLRGDMSSFNYQLRGEFAARKYITGYSANLYGFELEAEKGKIESLRQVFANQYGKTWENLFRNYDINVKRNLQIYDSMRDSHEIYLGKAGWSWDTYLKWKDRGVLYEDARKGVWIIGADKTVRPLAGLNMEEWRKSGKFLYDKDAAYQQLASEYSERPINATLLIKDSKGVFGHSAPLKDPELHRLMWQLTSSQAELIGARAIEGGIDASPETRMRRGMLEKNVATLTEILKDRIRWSTRTEAEHHGGILSRTGSSFSLMLERVFGAGTYNTAERHNQWYATQAHARVVLENFNAFDNEPLWSKSRENTFRDYLSPETQESMQAKRDLMASRTQQLELLKKNTLTPTESTELSQLRTKIRDLESRIPNLENAARLADKRFGGADRSLRELADMTVPFYNVSEMTVMRDPRIAFGGGYGMRPAIMVGYQTGQFVGERTNMWAGYNLVPSDRILNQLAKPAFVTSMIFGQLTRTFFTKMMGYTTMYQQNPETGPENERNQYRHAFQSLFRPTENFDWFTRLVSKPLFRRSGSYKDETGYFVKEEHDWGGGRFILPFSMKGAGSDNPFRTDQSRMLEAGIAGGASGEIRRSKLGLTFREWFGLVDNRVNATNPQGQLDQLRHNLSFTDSASERASIRSHIAELEDTMSAQRKIWRIPVIGKFFQQGYYAVENRTGYDMSAAGGAHRPWELFSPYFKNVGKAPVPGMIYTSHEGELRLFPRVAAMLINAPQDYDSYDPGAGVWRHRQIDPKGGMRKLLSLGQVGGSYGESVSGNIGRDALMKDSMRDVFRHEKNLLYQYMQIENEHMMYNFVNNHYIMPLAPPIMVAYQILKAIPYHGNPLRNWGATTATKYEKPLTPEEAFRVRQRMEAEMALGKSPTAPGGGNFWTCSVHGIHLPQGQICPVCHTELEDSQTRQKRIGTIKRIGHGMKDTLVSYAQSFVPFEYAPAEEKWKFSLRGMSYNYYVNQAHCPTHGIGYSRGMTCPMCAKGDFMESRQLTECPKHRVYYQRGQTCWKCSGREPNDYERITDTRPSYLGGDAMETYRKEIAKKLSNMRKTEENHEYTVKKG